MWVIELLVALSAALLVAGAPWSRGSRRTLVALLLATGIGALLLVVAGPLRWQLAPLLLLAGLGLLLGLLRLRRGLKPRAWWVRGLGGLLSLVLLAVAALPLLFFPMFELPKPRGPQKVGVTDLAVVDSSRTDPYFGGSREFAVRAWYPTTADHKGPTAPYVSKRFSRSAMFGPMKAVIFGHHHLIETSAYLDAPVAGTDLPVVVFVHGYNGYNGQNTVLAQDLASNGYVVLSIGTPGDAMAVEFPDGRIKEFRNPRFLQTTEPLTKAREKMESNPPPEQVQALIREVLGQSTEIDKALRLQVADVRHLLDLVEGGGLGRLDGHLDAGRIALSGQSFGGSVAGQACYEDTRCRVGVNLDGMQFGDLFGREIGKPFLMFENHDQDGPWLNDMTYRAPVRPLDAPPVIHLRVLESRHVDFADMTLSSPFMKRFVPNKVLGKVDGKRMIALTSDVVLAFLDEHLRGKTARLPQVVEAWPELVLRTPDLPEGWVP